MKTKLLISVLLLLTISNFQLAAQNADKQKSGDETVVPFQFSFVPGLSTNIHRQSPVDVSINLLGGYNYQVKSFEIGGIFNIVKNDVGTCQLAGMMNIAGGRVSGLQAAGMFNLAQSVNGAQMSGYINIAKQDVHTAQIAGMANIAGGKVVGAQLAGYFSLAREVEGLQLSGFSNLTKTITGAQISGFANITEQIDGVQLSGFANVSKYTEGAQVTGFTNITNRVNGFQLAGFANIARNVDGSQVSGFINIAKKVSGFQLGIFNFADSCGGLPIGVFSYVRTGYHKFEISFDEFSYTNLSFKTGVDQLYSIINIGYRPFDTEAPTWNYGFGLGSLFGGNNNYRYNIELTGNHVLKGRSIDEDNELYRFYFGIDRKLTNQISVDFGLTYNLLILDKTSRYYEEDFSSMATYTFTNNSYQHTQYQSWLGARIGFRF
jgi:hypothetical protein